VKFLEELSDGLLGRSHFFGDMRNDFGLAHWLGCHFVLVILLRYLSASNESRLARAKNPVFFNI
jgi:hypothetical protein